jgi:hypothetical protein
VRTTDGVVGTVALDTQTTVLLASRGEASSFAVLVHRVHDPVNAGVVSDRHVGGVHQDNLEVFVGGVLVDPVRVQHSQVHGKSASTLLSHAAQVASILQLVNTLVLGLTEHDTLGVGSLAATSANSHTQDNIALLGLVAKLVGLVSSGGASDLLDLLALAVLPRSVRKTSKRVKFFQRNTFGTQCISVPDTQKETQSIALLLSPHLLKVLVGSHCILGFEDQPEQ